MKTTLLTFVFALVCAIGCAQSIETKKSFFGMQFVQDGERLSVKEVSTLLESNKDAYYMFKKARKNATFTGILEFAGGFMIGVPLGQSIGNNPEPNWTLGGIGAGVAIIGTIISVNSDKKAKKAIETYNAGLDSSEYRFEPEINILANGYGLGLSINF